MKKVLVIDDDPAFSFQLEQLLNDEFVVESSVEAMSALGKINETNPDLILLDIDILGAMDGYAVLEAVRKDSKAATIPVIVLTNMGAKRKQEFIDAGADEFFVKGEVDFDRLKQLARMYASEVRETS